MKKFIEKNHLNLIWGILYIIVIAVVVEKYCSLIHVYYGQGCALDSIIIMKQKNCLPILALMVGILAVQNEKRNSEISFLIHYGSTSKIWKKQCRNALETAVTATFIAVLEAGMVCYLYFQVINNWQENDTFISAYLDMVELQQINVMVVIISNILTIFLLLFITQLYVLVIYNIHFQGILTMIVLVVMCTIDYIVCPGLYTLFSIKVKAWTSIYSCAEYVICNLLLAAALYLIGKQVLKKRDFIGKNGTKSNEER